MISSRVDLHCHSLYSDGTASPAELVAQARSVGVTALALTDHDNHDGWAELKAAADLAGDIEAVPGIEISTRQPDPPALTGSKDRRFDVLAYLFDPDSPALEEKLASLRRSREERNARMVEKLAGLGVRVSLERLGEIAGGRVIGRPHFARAMLEQGAVKSIREAFDLYLADGGPGYLPKETFSAVRAIELAAQAEGVCSIAHPFEHRDLELDFDRWKIVLEPMVDAGLVGLECYYPEHTRKQKRFFLKLAEHFGLVATGGSDYHGANRPGVALGTGRGGLNVPYETLEALRERQATMFG